MSVVSDMSDMSDTSKACNTLSALGISAKVTNIVIYERTLRTSDTPVPPDHEKH